MHVAALYSGGKDSTYAVHVAQQRGWDVARLVSILPEDPASMLYHVPDLHVVPLLAEAMGIPLITERAGAGEAAELEALGRALSRADADGVVVGAIASDYQHSRVNGIAHELGLRAFAPLWRLDQRRLLMEYLDAGIEAVFTAVSAEGLPPALPKEGAFAAGNSCLAVGRDSGIYFVTGGPAARVFHSADAGRTWKTVEVPLVKGNESSGAFSVAVDNKIIVVVGGNYREPGNSDSAAVYSQDGGATWLAAEGRPGGFRSAVAMFDQGSYLTVGTNGTDMTTDSGAHWKHTDPVSLNALTPDSMHGMWGAGPKGTVARFHNPLQYEIHARPEGQPELAIARTSVSHVR